MALTILEYAKLLDSRADLFWPSPPPVEKPKAKPHLARIEGIRAVTWSLYGTLINIFGGELLFEHPQQFIMDTALDKTIQEFKMWASMARKPGQPKDYLRQVYLNTLTENRMTAGTDKYPEIHAERIWESFIKKLMQKEYKFDAGMYGSLNEFSKKVAYFFHASLQGTACYAGVPEALKHVQSAGILQCWIADAQCFTSVQLQRGIKAQAGDALISDLFSLDCCASSYEVKVKKPSEKLFRHAIAAMSKRGIEPHEILHVGSRISFDVIPAKKLGLKTALFAGDKASLEATAEQFKDANSRPDLMFTELNQIAEVVG